MSRDMDTNYDIPTYVLARLQERISKINKHAARLGTPPAVLHVLREYEKIDTIDEIKQVVRMAEIKFSMESPKMAGGWQFVAVIDHTAAGNMVRVAPQFQNEQFNVVDATPTCDHCGTTRERKQTMVVQDDNGDRKRVGSNCMRDFLGHAVPSVWTVWDSFSAFIDEMDWHTRVRPEFDTWRALVVACDLLSSHEFKPASFGHESTLTQVHTIMANRAHVGKISDQAQQMAIDAYQWLMTNGDTSDYMQNLRVAMDLCEGRHAGLVVSLPNTYAKHLQREQARAIEAKVERADCVLGKQTISGAVTKCYTKDTDYGSRQVMVVLDDRGFSVWGSVPSAIWDIKIGDRVQFSATVEASDDPTFGFFKRPTKATRTASDAV